MNNVLVVAAHADDEILGVGGTLRKHVKNADNVYCLIMTNGVSSRSGATKDEIKLRNKECKKVASIIGFKESTILGFPDNEMDKISLLKIIKPLEKYIEIYKPKIIYTHHKGDVNIDHRLTFEAVMTACRPVSDNCPEKIYSFETLSSTEWQLNEKMAFQPNVFIDISSEFDDKINALKEYTSELRNHPHARSIKGVEILASFRGLQSNLKYAEAFKLERSIEK